MTNIKGATFGNFKKALDFLHRNITFAWTIDGYYKWRNKLASQVRSSYSIYPFIDNRDGCMVPDSTPDIYQTFAEKVLINAGIKSDFVTIHIRRGDAKGQCQTPLDKIKNIPGKMFKTSN